MRTLTKFTAYVVVLVCIASLTSAFLQSPHRKLIERTNLRVVAVNAEQVAAKDPYAVKQNKLEIPTNILGYDLLAGSPKRGLVVVEKLGCLDCHSQELEESSGYPSFSRIGERLDDVDLVESILYPSRSFSDGRPVKLETSDGLCLSGRVISVTASGLEIDTGSGTTFIQRRDIVEMKFEDSEMPSGLVETLDSQQFADLLAYLQSL